MKEKFWKKLLLLFVIAIIGFIGWFIYPIFINKPPIFFPLDDSQAEYKITKNCPDGQGWVEKIQTSENGFCVEYKGSGVLSSDQYKNNNFFRITVGKSKIDLEPFVDKKVKNIQGKYAVSSKQCIQDKCIKIDGSYTVLNIEKLEAVE